MLTAFAVLMAITALMAWANERFFRIPTTVAVTLAGALASILIIGLDAAGLSLGIKGRLTGVLETLDFTAFVLNGILSLLLFAGSLSLDARFMLRQRASILTLAIGSTIISTFVVAGLAYGVFNLVGLGMPLIWAFVFGALISPTDPVAVLDLLKRAHVPKRIETLIAGESLFNDGVGVVIYLVVAAIAGVGAHGQTESPSALGVLRLFGQEAVGGMLFGAVVGYVMLYLTKTIEAHAVEILITLAGVVCGYVAAAALGVSGPLAMVVAGLVMSAYKDLAYHGETRHLVEGFWETLDQVLNILLFAFIGLDVLLTETTVPQIVASVLMIGVALLARLVSVAAVFPLVRSRDGYGSWTVRLLTWGGLRGGIAISLCLGLPGDSPYRSTIVTVTYVIVLFTIAVQGLTVMPFVRRAVRGDPDRIAEAAASADKAAAREG